MATVVFGRFITNNRSGLHDYQFRFLELKTMLRMLKNSMIMFQVQNSKPLTGSLRVPPFSVRFSANLGYTFCPLSLKKGMVFTEKRLSSTK